MSYDEETKTFGESLAMQRPDGIAILLDSLNPALAQVVDVIEADWLQAQRDSPAVWIMPGMVLTYVGAIVLRGFQICILGTMMNAMEDHWKVNGFATIWGEPPSQYTPFSTLEIEVPVLPGRQRSTRPHPSNTDWSPQ